ncbi:MAG: peptide chain release factor 2 [Thermoguttaceae bacterium]|nr:peptide chain release factor 2 [Thermoguttaceae bacterium]
MEQKFYDRAKQARAKLMELRASLDCEGRAARAKEIENLMGQPGFWDDQDKAQELMDELKATKGVIKPFDEALAACDDMDAIMEIAEEDESCIDEAVAEIDKMEKTLEELSVKSLLSGPVDNNAAIVSIQARDGGTDANDWAEMLLRMYINWAEMNSYKVEIIDRQDNEEAGINSASIIIRGPFAFGYLKGETGTHRLVRISPYNAEGKRQTSFASVDVMPDIADSVKVDIKEEDVREDVFRSSGAGGQHVNKTSSAIRLTHIPTGIVVQCQNERSQHKNRATAWKMLRAKMAQIEEDKREEMAYEHYQSKAKVGFGSQIRNYFLHPDQRVKDARTGYYVGNFHSVLNGNIQGFLDAYLEWLAGKDVNYSSAEEE